LVPAGSSAGAAILGARSIPRTETKSAVAKLVGGLSKRTATNTTNKDKWAKPKGGKMSRIKLKGNTPNLTVVVGLDRPMQQWFYQVWDSKVSEDYPVKDSMSEVLQGGASRGDMLEVISKFAKKSERRSLVEHAIALDTDPGVFFIF